MYKWVRIYKYAKKYEFGLMQNMHKKYNDLQKGH
jgi:hypothetical protein